MTRALASILLAIAAGALQACVAGVIPLAAGAAMTTSRAEASGKAAAANESSRHAAAPTVASGPATAFRLLPQTEEALRDFDPGAGARLLPLTSLPVPDPSAAAGAADEATYAAFADYALGVAAIDQPGGDARQSALLARPGLLVPERAPCNFTGNAVLIDLDPADGALDTTRVQENPALTRALARLRAAGVEVVWSASLTADRAGDVRSWLRRSGLDPQGKDRQLLLRYSEDRKQTRRKQASSETCLIAMLGDERSDFDELFDYLKNPDAAVGLDAMLGKGWFLAPVSAAEPEAAISDEGSQE